MVRLKDISGLGTKRYTVPRGDRGAGFGCRDRADDPRRPFGLCLGWLPLAVGSRFLTLCRSPSGDYPA